MSKRPLTIYLADLVHNQLMDGSYMFPLNIGFISAYCKQEFGDQVDIRLFKFPGDLIDALKNKTPDVVGFSNYVWNADINCRIAAQVVRETPEVAVVMGGPDFNGTPDGISEWFNQDGYKEIVDFYSVFQGERSFNRLVAGLLEHDKHELRRSPIDGIATVHPDTGEPIVGKLGERIKDVETIPSPYLTGALDEFFQVPLIPIVETNRGCPYKCTFCAQGLSSGYRVEFFSEERVFAELEYVAQRTKKSNILIFADANFGIKKRDLKIAKYIKGLQQEYGYPRRVSMNWAKNRGEGTVEIAQTLGMASQLILSMQSTDAQTLDAVKRNNIGTKTYQKVARLVREAGGDVGTELIVGLPGESKESHLNTLRDCFNWGMGIIICYNALVIRGSEMDQADRITYKIATKHRLTDSAFGEYDGIRSFESERGVRSTSTMSEKDIYFFRPLHWLIQLMWNYDFYDLLIQYIMTQGRDPVDFLIKLVENGENSSIPAISELFQDFQRESEAEWFDTREDLIAFYGDPENFQKLKDGDLGGKLNSRFMWRTLMTCASEFSGYVEECALEYLGDRDEHEKPVKEILRYLSLRQIDFSASDVLANFQDRSDEFSYDFQAWERACFDRKIGEFAEPVVYRFKAPEDRREALSTLMSQYKHHNLVVTLRKMSEYMCFQDLFYEVESADPS